MNSEPSPASTDWADRVAHLRALLEQRQSVSPDTETGSGEAESVSPDTDALARDQKIDFRLSQGERELWERAAQAVGVTTSEFVRGVVNGAAEEALAAAYTTTE